MNIRDVLFPLTAAGAVFGAIAYQQQVGAADEADRIAWQTLAEISRPARPIGAGAGETAVSWRTWWTSVDVYPDASLNLTPQSADTAAKFRRIPCQEQSEKRAAFPDQPQTSKPCEVVWLDGAAAGYIFQNGLWKRENLNIAAAAHRISFPQSANYNHIDPRAVAIEMKTEWAPIADAQSGRFILAIDQQQTTRALVAFHMMIRAQPNWIWATFIHEDYAQLVTQAGASFRDSFGSRDGRPSAGLRRLLRSRRAEFLAHYKLIGTQTDFSTLLGNPLIEPAALMKQKKISCISCHAFAAVDSVGHVPHQSPQAGVPQIPPIFNSVNFDFTLTEHAKCSVMAQCST
ncbi:MAG: hypothetical protein JO340_09245 [Acidobacteriaceae bacterium]|nr:hypothetical protein [Acidobacteriaceae bacterium]